MVFGSNKHWKISEIANNNSKVFIHLYMLQAVVRSIVNSGRK